jgi:ribosomal protein L16 Arg81 hydroxylase
VHFTPTFLDLVGDEEVFFGEYFNKKPLLRLGALSEQQAGRMLSARELDDLLNSEMVRPPHVAVSLGDSVQERTYTTPIQVQYDPAVMRVIPERLMEFFRAGATVKWSSLNHLYPHMRRLTEMLSLKFSCRSDVIAFVTPAGQPGYKPHQDPGDVFIIQTEGTKDWQLWNPDLERNGWTRGFKVEDLGEPEIKVTLRPGDVLYLPYNTPHMATCTEFQSIHLSALIMPLYWSDRMSWVVSQVVKKRSEFTKYPYFSESNATLHDEFSNAVEDLHKILSSLTPEELMAIARSEPEIHEGSVTREFFTVQAQADSLSATQLVRRDEAWPLALKGPEVDGAQRVVINGTMYSIPAKAFHVIRAMGGGTRVAREFVPGESSDDNLQLVKRLIKFGILAPC